MAGDRGYIVISEANFFIRDRLIKYAKDNNITNDKLTYEQYQKYSEQRAKEGGGFGFSFKKSGGGPDRPRSKDARTEKPSEPAPSKPAAVEKTPSGPSITTRTVSDDELERRPVLYRAGNLPPGLPDWFEKIDKDKDGQVDLGEWRLAGKEIAEFRKMDLNNDGLLTPDEVLRYLATPPKVQASEGNTSSTGGVASNPADATISSNDGSDASEKTGKESSRGGRKRGPR